MRVVTDSKLGQVKDQNYLQHGVKSSATKQRCKRDAMNYVVNHVAAPVVVAFFIGLTSYFIC